MREPLQIPSRYTSRAVSIERQETVKRCKEPPVILYNFNQNGISIVQTEFLVNLDVFCILWQFDDN